MDKIAVVNMASLGGYLHYSKTKEPDRRKGSTMNSTATCSNGEEFGSVRLYLAPDSPYDEKKLPCLTSKS